MRPKCQKCSGFLMPDGPFVKCFNCGKLFMSDDEPVKLKIYKVDGKRAAMSQELDDNIDRNWSEITDLRSRRVAVATICESLGFIGSPSTYQKRILEREDSEGIVRERKRPRGIPYAKRKLRHVQDHLRGRACLKIEQDYSF